jgi:hypothetical protein
MMATWIWLGVPLTVLVAIGAAGVRTGLVRQPGGRAATAAAPAATADGWLTGLAEGDERLVRGDPAACRAAPGGGAVGETGRRGSGTYLPGTRSRGRRACWRPGRAGTTAGCEDTSAVPG